MRVALRLLTLIVFAVAIFDLLSSDSSTEYRKRKNIEVAAAAAQPAPSPSPAPVPSPAATVAPCSGVNVDLSPHVTVPGKPITVTASVSGGGNEPVSFVWSTFGGRIVKGQGTNSIEIVPDANRRNIDASIEIETGACRASAALTIPLEGLPPSDFGKLAGIVRDPKNRRLKGATVTVFLNNNSTAKETTKDGGKYEFGQLVVGDYDVEASHDQYRPVKKTAKIKKDQTTPLNFKFK